MEWLSAVRDLGLSDCWIAAGFVRNLVWDHLFDTQTVLNDIDVVFFDPEDVDNSKAKQALDQLKSLYPEQNWQVKNQAFMHHKNHDRPYKSVFDAMSFWPEKETAVAVSMSDSGIIQVASAFGLDSLFQGHISHNPARELSVFNSRIRCKKWLEIWPKLKVTLK